jgi:hypothetical protein
MQTVTKDVKTKGKKVSEVTVETFDSIDELLSNMTETAILELVNKQRVTNALNAERQKFSDKPAGKARRRELAINLAFKDDPNKLQELFAEAIANGQAPADALEAYLETPEVQALVDVELGGNADTVADPVE